MVTPSEIAAKYKNRECSICVQALCESFSGTVLKIDIQDITPAKWRHIMHVSLSPNNSISTTGLHYAFLINGTVYDNLHPSGVSRKEWSSNFLFLSANGSEERITDIHISEMAIDVFLSEKNA
ncbi:papain fold toxin domain-containing protein [Vibrio parahaemolyticus]|uniref:papain fold toxin domain-containing protein n=1 Tax=Vibrio parahaemolyticus TaxID=670 RepID=UPI00111E0C3D|nr:papain fold toxin domain-containing protein [Vibrio parahaemolyticus]TOG87870.1 hypothetical protein CGI92_23530 [Vibrio parahaemolyticus]